jgi:hypothetical protein
MTEERKTPVSQTGDVEIVDLAEAEIMTALGMPRLPGF